MKRIFAVEVTIFNTETERYEKEVIGSPELYKNLVFAVVDTLNGYPMVVEISPENADERLKSSVNTYWCKTQGVSLNEIIHALVNNELLTMPEVEIERAHHLDK